MEYFVYIIECSDGSLYTGITTDVARRMAEHMQQGESSARYTRSHRAISLDALWRTDGRSSASALEYRIKKLSRGAKLDLVAHPEKAAEKFGSEERVYTVVSPDVRGAFWQEAIDGVAAQGEEPAEKVAAKAETPSISHASSANPDCAVSPVDMHCHLGFSPRFEELTAEVEASGSAVFCNTVTPAEFTRLRGLQLDTESAKERADAPDSMQMRQAGSPVVLGLGLHPWWVPDDGSAPAATLGEFEELLPRATAVGEIGLDFSKTRVTTRDAQTHAFGRILELCSQRGDLTLSVHAVKSADVVLDMLEESKVLESCRCIMHWFSGTSQDLSRAVSLGCWFSVGNRMADSKRGREYIKAIPPNRILLETDLPANEGDDIELEELHRSLLKVAAKVQKLSDGWTLQAANEAAFELLGIGR